MKKIGLILLSTLISFVCCSCQKIDNQEIEMKIIHIDCGRKYFNIDTLKSFIDQAKACGLSYVELAIGNDGCRFLLDDMSIQVQNDSYSSEQIKKGIHLGNEGYADFEVDELYEKEMDELIQYAHQKNIDIIPLINTPGHMDAILYCLEYCGVDCASYHHSLTTIDISNSKAVQFTTAILDKYIDYFSKKGCKYFSIGADEYANDVYTKGSMGFGNLLKENTYGNFIDYVNSLAAHVKEKGMIPIAFNDGIYFKNQKQYGTFDTDIIICYWSNGWLGYSPCSAKKLQEYGFELINANSDYYWVLGDTNWQCSVKKMSKFNINKFKGSKVNMAKGAMFCIWCDKPFEDTDENILNQTKEVIQKFGNVMNSQ